MHYLTMCLSAFNRLWFPEFSISLWLQLCKVTHIHLQQTAAKIA